MIPPCVRGSGYGSRDVRVLHGTEGSRRATRSRRLARTRSWLVVHFTVLCGSTARAHFVEGKDREFRVDGNSGTRSTSPQTVPRLAAKTAAARVRVSPSLSGVKSPTRSSVTVSSNLRRARRTSTAPSVVACISLRLKPGEQLLCYSHALHRWHSLLCSCHSCDSDGLALTGPQSLVLRLV